MLSTIKRLLSKKTAPVKRTRFNKDILQAASGRGEWVPAERMWPEANVAGRLYRTKDGAVLRARNFPLREKPEAWFFSDDE